MEHFGAKTRLMAKLKIHKKYIKQQMGLAKTSTCQYREPRKVQRPSNINKTVRLEWNVIKTRYYVRVFKEKR